MIGNSKVHHGVPAEGLTVLKPQKLGRHYHKIPRHIKETISKHPRLIGEYFLNNYRLDLELSRIDIQEQRQQPPECIYYSSFGKAGFSIDRALLTETLESYYGGTVSSSQNTPPISASEQRMRNRLGADIANLLLRAMLSGENLGELISSANDYEEATWEYVAEFEYISQVTGSKSSIFIYLDTDLADELILRLTGPAPARPAATGNPIDNIKHLPVRLDCVIAMTQMPLSQVLALEPNDVLMVRPLDRYEIRINQQKLFRGAIFEDDGALYLTSLESVNSQ